MSKKAHRSPIASTADHRSRNFFGPFLIAVCAGLVVLFVGLWINRPAPPEPIPQGIAWLYEDFFRQGRITFYLSKPTVYKYATAQELKLAAAALGGPLEAAQGSALKTLGIIRTASTSDELPYLIRSPDQYTGIGDALAIISIQRTLFRYAHDLQAQVFRSDINQALEASAVVLGGWLANDRFEDIINNRGGNALMVPFRSHDGALHIANTDAVAYAPAFDGHGALTTDYALVTVLRKAGSTLLFCAGVNSQGTEAAGAFVSDDARLINLAQRVKGPQDYQLVIRVSVGKGGAPDLSRLDIVDVRRF